MIETASVQVVDINNIEMRYFLLYHCQANNLRARHGRRPKNFAFKYLLFCHLSAILCVEPALNVTSNNLLPASPQYKTVAFRREFSVECFVELQGENRKKESK